jgi:hypothetical protein
MIIGHLAGIPVEESLVQLAPAGAVIATALAVAVRTSIGRLRRSSRKHCRDH